MRPTRPEPTTSPPASSTGAASTRTGGREAEDALARPESQNPAATTRHGWRHLRSAGHVLRTYPLPAIALALLAVSLVLWVTGHSDLAQWPLIAVIVIGGLPLVWETLNQILHGELGVDLIAILAISGSLLLHEYLAGALVVLMLSGGEALEAYALQRARSSLAALAERTPRWAHVRRGAQIETVSADTVQAGQEIVVKPGELVPVDGTVIGGASDVSEADLTGEPLPVRKETGAAVLSGSVNLDGVLDVRAARAAAESHYAQIVRLVEEAQKSRAPIHRLADRYAVWFTGLALTLAALAWAISGDIVYALAVLVVATPCPLILATPIAIMSGMNRAAKMGIILTSGAAMEQLGEVNVAVFDKTGTLTLGLPQLVDVLLCDETSAAPNSTLHAVSLAEPPAPATASPGPVAGAAVPTENPWIRALLQLAASVEQFSAHILARAVVQAAVERGIPPLAATEIEEVPGKGVRASVSGPSDAGALRAATTGDVRTWHETTQTGASEAASSSQSVAVAVGNRAFLRHLDISIPEQLVEERARLANLGKLASFVAVAGRVVALLVFADTPRPEIARLAPELHAAGIAQITLLTGDSETVAKQVGTLAGMDRIIAQCLPEDKVKEIAALQADGHRVLMVGDGVNDAPALALATVGMAVGAQGLNASAAVADAVLLSTEILQTVAAVRLGRHVLRVAKQGIWLGIGLSIAAMVVAAFGYIPPAVGAILQEGVDVLVIFNALRAGRPPHVG